MTTSISTGTLAVTITEVVTLNDGNGNDHGLNLTTKVEIASVARASSRIISVPTSEIGLLAFATDLATAPAATTQDTYAAGHFDEDLVRYVRITNLDDTNHVTLLMRNGSGDEFAVLLDKGMSYILGVDQTGGTRSTVDAATGALTVSLQDLEDITAQADTAACDLEVVVATV